MTDTAVTDATFASAKPQTKPARPFFSSGPCAKPPGWDAAKLAADVLGRPHLSKLGKARLQYCIDLMREMLALPDTHRIGIVPGSDTGARSEEHTSEVQSLMRISYAVCCLNTENINHEENNVRQKFHDESMK